MSLPLNIKLLQSETFTSSLNQLRDRSLKPAGVRGLVRELSATVSSAAISKPSPNEKTALVVILRSGMAMSDAFLEQFGDEEEIVVYHLGLFREQATLEPVEYYNKLPIKDPRITRAYVVDPLIATGGTAVAAIEILKDWGVSRVSFVSILASKVGIMRVASAFPEETDFTIGAIDETLDNKGYVQPGLGDIGDRLFGTQLS